MKILVPLALAVLQEHLAETPGADDRVRQAERLLADVVHDIERELSNPK